MSRYQPFIWAVFRREVFLLAMAGADVTDGAVFKELTFMSRAVLKGRVARLPIVFAMRGMEESRSPAIEVDPWMWFLHDSATFYRGYSQYRNSLAAYIRAEPHLLDGLPATNTLEHVLDLNHASFFGRLLHTGMINHQAQLLLGRPLPPIQLAPQWPGSRVPEAGDLVHVSSLDKHSFIWRKAVLQAEPRDDIVITAEEIATVEKQFDAYWLD
jgi:hypothetical protein